MNQFLLYDWLIHTSCVFQGGGIGAYAGHWISATVSIKRMAKVFIGHLIYNLDIFMLSMFMLLCLYFYPTAQHVTTKQEKKITHGPLEV